MALFLKSVELADGTVVPAPFELGGFPSQAGMRSWVRRYFGEGARPNEYRDRPWRVDEEEPAPAPPPPAPIFGPAPAPRPTPILSQGGPVIPLPPREAIEPVMGPAPAPRPTPILSQGGPVLPPPPPAPTLTPRQEAAKPGAPSGRPDPAPIFPPPRAEVPKPAPPSGRPEIPLPPVEAIEPVMGPPKPAPILSQGGPVLPPPPPAPAPRQEVPKPAPVPMPEPIPPVEVFIPGPGLRKVTDDLGVTRWEPVREEVPKPAPVPVPVPAPAPAPSIPALPSPEPAGVPDVKPARNRPQLQGFPDDSWTPAELIPVWPWGKPGGESTTPATPTTPPIWGEIPPPATPPTVPPIMPEGTQTTNAPASPDSWTDLVQDPNKFLKWLGDATNVFQGTPDTAPPPTAQPKPAASASPFWEKVPSWLWLLLAGAGAYVVWKKS